MTYAPPIETSRYEAVPLPSGRLGMWWLLGSEIVIFGGLIVSYLLMRWFHPEWAEAAKHTSETIGVINTIVLLTSSLTMVLAHHASEHRQAKRAVGLMGLTCLLGGLFLAIKTYEYSHEIAAGFTPMAGLFWSYYYLMTGLHALHIVAGLIAILLVMRRVARGKDWQRVEYVGIYWHFVDVVWIFLFPILYLAPKI